MADIHEMLAKNTNEMMRCLINVVKLAYLTNQVPSEKLAQSGVEGVTTQWWKSP